MTNWIKDAWLALFSRKQPAPPRAFASPDGGVIVKSGSGEVHEFSPTLLHAVDEARGMTVPAPLEDTQPVVRPARRARK
jgi:hypothetical protein